MPGQYVAFYGPVTLLHSMSVRAAPSLEQAITAADAMAGRPSTPADWRPLRKADPARPALDPPPVATHRRRCPDCSEYSDSLRWEATRTLPLDLPDGWEIDGPRRVADLYRCWWCGYSETHERPSP